jgi:branched-chain amino acid transport system ATP-binding protein
VAGEGIVTGAQPILAVRGLCKNFGALAVAQSIDLDLAAGARLGLIGPNGAGKTTFVNLLTGMIAADAGDIMLEGQSIARLRPEDRVRRGLARTHQINTLLIEEPARDNVAVAIAERDRYAWRMLRFGRQWRACLEEAQGRLDEMGIGAIADRTVRELPYGQQRLLEIAIAMALKPRVLLLDEPGAGVPAAEAHVIHDALDRLPRDMAILIIEHDMDLVFRFAQEIVVMVQGRVLVRDVPAAIAANPEVRSVYLGRSRL